MDALDAATHFRAHDDGLVGAQAADGLQPALERLGWTVEVGDPGKSGTQLDVVVAEL